MSDILDLFRKKVEDALGSINRSGGLRGTIEGLRRQMAEADRKRALSRARAEVKSLNLQVDEMVNAIGLQTVGLYEAGKLLSPELEPLCQHIVRLKQAVALQEKELARLAAEVEAEEAARKTQEGLHASAGQGAVITIPGAQRDAAVCKACGKPLFIGAAFCAACGSPVAAPIVLPEAPDNRPFCASCGAVLRQGARFCAKCGTTVMPSG